MNKNIINSNEHKIRKNSDRLVSHEYQITKSLSPVSLVMIGLIYSFVLIKSTIYYYPKNKEIKTLTSNEIEKILDKKLSKALDVEVLLPNNYLSKDEFYHLKKELLREVRMSNKIYLNNLNETHKSYQKLKFERNMVNDDILQPTSFQKTNKVLAYNERNKNILWTKFDLKKKRLKERIEKEKNKLLITLNLGTEEGQEIFKNFQDNSQLKIKTLTEDYYAQMRKFKKQQYILIDD